MPLKAAKAVLVLGLALHLHIHHFHGPAVDYVGLAAASAASWIGVPGPGEPVLIATAVLAAKHHLGIVSVLFVAFMAANAGGIGGWLIGRRAGRGLVTVRGPLRKIRVRALERSDDVFKRYAVVAAHPELQERELLKRASQAAAVAEALRQRGVTEPAASLAAESGVIVFKTAYARWASDPGAPDLSQLIREALGQLHTMAAPAPAAGG